MEKEQPLDFKKVMPDFKIEGLDELIEIQKQFKDLVERISNFKIVTTAIRSN